MDQNYGENIYQCTMLLYLPLCDEVSNTSNNLYESYICFMT